MKLTLQIIKITLFFLCVWAAYLIVILWILPPLLGLLPDDGYGLCFVFLVLVYIISVFHSRKP